MSSAEAERKRRDALAALKARKAANPTPSTSSSAASHRPSSLSFGSSSSPESSSRASTVLVPPSSSPGGPSTSSASSRYFNGSNGISNGSRSLGGNVIPSSRLGGGGGGGGAGGAGTPLAVMNAIHSRRTADDTPRQSGPSSLSYETTIDTSRPDLSPSSPAPLSRLKKRYDDSPSSAPSAVSHPKPNPIRPTSPGSPSSPVLVSAAKVQQLRERELMISKMATQFNNLSREIIARIVRDNPGDPDRAIHLVHQLSVKTGNAGSGEVGRANGTGSSSPAAHYSSDPLAMSQPVAPPAPKFAPKPKKNEKSRIYANRGDGGKRRKDPDDESESEGGVEEDDEEEGSEMDWSGEEGGPRKKRRKDEVDAEGAALKAFNEVEAGELTGTIACSVDQAAKIIGLRPYEDVDEVRSKLTKARGVSFKLFEQYTEIMEGYVQIDACLNRCEEIAQDVANTLAVWRGASTLTTSEKDSVVGTPRSDGLNDVKVDVSKVSELLRREMDPRRKKILASYVRTQPATMSEGTVLKDYQLLGVNWLNLLWRKKIGCILADEMGLGKTIQVIAFLAHLKERGNKGPHMIFVPASTLENWIREFERFAPGIDVQTYYGSQAERAALRDDLKRKFRANKLEVVLASYTQVASYDDLSFFRKKIEFETCIYDEGHRLKSCTTKAYSDLVSIKPKWRLLLTGTPLQNNLQELVSLLMFIHKDVFTDAEPYLRAIFKSQGHANLLSNQRTSRARTMLTPFVLRRRKAHVLDLPPKIETVEHCEMTKVQATLYRDTLSRSRKVLEEMSDGELEKAAGEDDEDLTGSKAGMAHGGKKGAKKKQEKKAGGAFGANSTHILMDLRKAASHPLLFRRLYTDAKVKQIAKECLNTDKWADSNYDYVVEDLEVMTDAEIHHFCKESEYNSLRKFALPTKHFLEAGKVAALEKHIKRCQKEGKRMLLFSQFVMVLDILQVALDHLKIKYTRLDGQTKTDERQGLVDEFNEDPDIAVFLLSTKAGGVGINLTAASVVIIFDQDFNPHNDRQAADRAYRIGQEKEVEVIKLISKGSIDEDMLAIGVTKLQLDDAVGGEEITLDGGDTGAAGKDDQTAKEVKKSLLTKLRNKFEEGHEVAVIAEDEGDVDVKGEDGLLEETPGKTRKIARAAGSQMPVKEE